MFSCLWQLWDWLDPAMENKKGGYQNPPNEIIQNEAIPKHSHQHNIAPQHLRLLQYGLKIPSNQPLQQQINSPLHIHMHQPAQYHQPTHRHLQSPQQFNSKNFQNYIHQHQKIPNHPIYQTNQPPPLHPHSQVTQNSPQIWVPVHYHNQQNKLEQKQNPPQLAPKPKENVERKKSSGTSQLRSPTAKRPPEAPVTMQGWLHKQGSEGLMFWKKRWFVLSEYCLFYYKGPEEEKLLGSILLPSYKVSICVPEDKVNRKFAFKCEHANMRTYILAADSQELMMQWIRVLNFACLLQTNTESDQPVPSENTVSQIHQSHNSPVHMHSSSNTTDLSNPSQEISQYNQPLYANAPPKPRRLNDGSYSSPSPDVLERYSMRSIPKSPVNIYSHSPQPEYILRPKQDYVLTPTRELQHLPHNVERRTPDIYGRSKLNPKSRTDYEDVYTDQAMYKRPLSPVAYSHVKKVNPIVNPAYRAYTPVNMHGPRELVQYPPLQMRKSPIIARPHSADFLEYELNHRPNPNTQRQQTRPKSSLDINRNDSDNYFYSEERYAEKMRKSAQYLPKMPRYYSEHVQRRVPDKYPENENTFPLMRSSTQPINFNNLQINEMQMSSQPVRSRSVLSEGSLSKELDVDLRSSPREPISPAFMRQTYGYEDLRNYDQFTRSASARLAGSQIREGDRKREESMKRLLEWKQRMLQSPLNRKAQSRMYPREIYYKNQEEYLRNHDVYQEDRRPVPHYNSYSSDDEENEERSKETVQSQAGRTLDTNNSESLAHTTSITVFNTPTEPDKPLTQPDTMHDTHSEDSTFTKSLVQFKSSNLAHVSSLRSEYSNKFEQSPTVTEIKSNGALVKSILAEFEKKTDDFEENYMTMTPKKNVPDESPYEEMTQNALVEVVEQQPYEMLCFGNGKFEPVYMELKNPKTDLPDIIIQNEKSDSSDADDEASKDLDSLDTPSHPRFSLSDSFRPASYYLGVNRTVPEFQDSSDSELVSPPPIPTSPPPLEDLDNDENRYFNRAKNDKKQDQDNCSVGSVNTDPEVRFSSRLSQNSDSDVELRSLQYERMLKRRPVSEEFCDELESLDENFNDSIDLDKYLTGLEISNVSVTQFHEYENLYIPSFAKIKKDDGRESSASTSAEISAFLQSNRISSSLSAQESSYFSPRDKSLPQPAPYYYSDLSMNTSNDSACTILTLNNQRGTMNGSKRDITHIINPIKCNTQLRNGRSNIDSTFKLAAEARSASVDFLNLTDKSGHIDKKNIYESDTLKRLKVAEQIQSNPETRNIYPARKVEKFLESEINVRRSHSLEGLLENVLESETSARGSTEIAEGSYLWEEDSIWRERLRSASQRHTKSMDDLDSIGENKKIQKKNPRGITRGVTYVNDNVYNMPHGEKKNEIRKEGSFVIDREKLRQWDLMSSAPSDDQLSVMAALQVPRDDNTVVETGEGNTCEPTESTDTQPEASGSVSITRDTFPKAISAKRMWTQNSQPVQSRSVTNLARPPENEGFTGQEDYYIEGPNQHPYKTRKENWSSKMNMSAGELLGRTHEELVLLLIQLRRQSANTLQAIENSYNEIDNLQAQLQLMDQEKRLENLQKLEQIKQHLLELEKQYEKGKPLVNLVDNMVKLGSLYRSPNDRNVAPNFRDRLEFNQHIQERRLLAEEKRDWNRLNPNHLQLQEKVQQLYHLDRLIHEESGTLQNLQQDKEEIERALGGLRHRINEGFKDPAEVEQARKQQANLENELSRVHLMLAQNSKKLEETVAGNARLEQELLVLKQKLQLQRQQRSSPQFSNAGDSLPCAMGTSAMLESDLQRVQQKVGDLQKQRQELSMQVRQLTDRSNNLQQQIKHVPSINQGNKKKVNSLWRETDLDTMSTTDHGESWDNELITPLYVHVDMKQSESDFYNRSDSTSDETIQNLPQEKQEIKTVRIVKRESERRQRDREKTTTGKWDALIEEDTSSQNSSVLFRPAPLQKPIFDTDGGILSRQSSLSSPSLPQFSDRVSSSSLEKSPELSPIFKSEAARQIITEMSVQEPQKTNRRAVPREKRRHYTAPHNNLIMKSLHHLPTDSSFDKLVNERRARDDLDMERALRQRIDAPDVVRSTLSSKELKYNENTIDNILGTPNKISIPERYIPEQLPQLSAEEQEYRLRKVESIKKMLSDAAIISTSSSNLASGDEKCNKTPNSIANKATTKMIEEKKQREHLLQLNQILAKQVMEMSKIVAVKALATLPLQPQQMNTDDEDSSPVTPLPLYQQRDNFYS